MKLVITADDFGIATGTSRAIIALLDGGLITSTSVMACITAGLDVAAEHRDVLRGKAGVHLQLSPSRFLSPERARYFQDLAELSRIGGATGSRALTRVESEWRRQIEAVTASIGAITHIDSHHGIHLEEPFLDVAEDLAQHFEVGLRGPRGWNDGRVQFPVGEYTIGDWTLSGQAASSLVSQILTLVDGRGGRAPASIEIVTHPGIVDDELEDRSSATSVRETELVELFRLRSLLDKAGFGGWRLRDGS